MNRNSFAKNLRRLRLENGYTQERLAEKLGVNPQAVSRWECGNALPDVMQLPALAQMYGITVDDFYREEIETYPNYAQRLLAVYESSGRTEDFLAAEQEFLRLIAGEHTADDMRAFGVLYHYMMNRCASRALDYLEAVLAGAENTDWVWHSAAQQRIALLCDLGRGAEEAAKLDRELDRNISDPRRWLLCIAAHHFIGDNKRALELAQNALSKFPENAMLYIYAGDICRALKSFDEAFIYWQRAKELDKAPLDAYYSMGFCCEELGQYGKAYEVWRDLRKELIGRGLTQDCQLPMEHMRLCEERMR